MYYVSLKQFEGPLDLLLHLITRAKVDIKDIFVSEITEQYLASMGSVDELDMDTASEFLTMAARCCRARPNRRRTARKRRNRRSSAGWRNTSSIKRAPDA